MQTQTQTLAPLTLTSFDVEKAFMAACADHAIKDPHKLANLTQAVCHWCDLNEAGRVRVLEQIRTYFPIH